MKILIQIILNLLQNLQEHPVIVNALRFISIAATNQRVFKTRQPLSTGCIHRPMDISFVVDASGSIGTDAFKKCLRFIEDIIDTFDISRYAVRVSLVTYGEVAYEEHAFGFKRYLDKDRLKKAILAIPYSDGGGTHTSKGIRYMLQNHYPETRSDVHRVAIVITDGQSNDRQETAAAASDARNAYNQVFAIGVGPSLSSESEELFKIASDASCVLNIDSYDTIHTIKEALIQKTCNYSIEQLDVAVLEKKMVVEGSIEQLQKMCEDVVTELKKKRGYLEEEKIVGKDNVKMLGGIPALLKSGIDDMDRDIDTLNFSFKTSTEQSNEEDLSAEKQKYLEAASAQTRDTVEEMCRTIEELLRLLKDIAREISEKIELMSRTTEELQKILREINRELTNNQRPVRYIGTGIAILGACAAAVMTGGLAAPLAVAAGSLASIHAVGKYMEKEAFKKAQAQWNGYGSKLKGSGLLWIIGQEMINGQWDIHIENAGKAFKEMHMNDANCEQIAKKYFKDRNVAYFIFSGLDFIQFLKWLLSLSGHMEFHLNSFIDTELVGILRALNNMEIDIKRN